MKKRLTDRFLQSVTPPASERDTYSDTEADGLELRVSPRDKNGVVLKAWSIRYHLKGGERRRVTYRSYPAVTLAEARARAKEIAAAAARGIDLPEQEERQREEERKAAKRPQTVGDLLDGYVDKYCKTNQRRCRLVERMFDMHVKPARIDGRPLGQKPLVELHRADLVQLLDDLQNEKGLHAQVNRVRSQLLAALNWAIEREYLETNPAAAIKKRKIEASRDRVLTDEELRSIWRAADQLSDPSRSLVKAWILTGQRRDEIAGARWSEVDFERAVLELPAGRVKVDDRHVVPLTPAVVEILEGLPRFAAGDYLFSGQTAATRFSGFSKARRRLNELIGEIEPFTLHDLRRTTRTRLSELGVTPFIAELVIGHTQKGVHAVYDLYRYHDEKQAALLTWEAKLLSIVAPEPAPNVVPMSARARA